MYVNLQSKTVRGCSTDYLVFNRRMKNAQVTQYCELRFGQDFDPALSVHCNSDIYLLSSIIYFVLLFFLIFPYFIYFLTYFLMPV